MSDVFHIVDRPQLLQRSTPRGALKRAVIESADSGKAVLIDLNGTALATLRSRLSGNWSRDFRAMGLRLHVRQNDTKSGLYAWAEKITDEKG